MTEELPVGRRVAYWRNRRNLTQQVFADRLGRSKSWVDKVERGVRRLDSISILREVAGVLAIDPAVLLDQKGPDAAPAGHDGESIDVEAIRSALEQEAIIVVGSAQSEPRPWGELRESVDRAWSEWQHPWSEAQARVLSGLIRDARAAAVHHSGCRQQVARLLSEVYQLASRSLRRLGQSQLAWLAADRSVSSSRDAQDELLFASAIAQVAAALTALGRPRPAFEICVTVAGRITTANSVDWAKALSVYGFLLMRAAMAAAKLGDSMAVTDLVTAAEAAARRLGREEHHYAATFGPVALLLHRVAVDVELGEMARAVATHEELVCGTFASVLPERRWLHLLTVARAYAQLGHSADAAHALAEADRLAPAEVSRRPATPALVADIVRGRVDPVLSPSWRSASASGLSSGRTSL
jgi:transcriptional regulator with XRE-family HTH domain